MFSQHQRGNNAPTVIVTRHLPVALVAVIGAAVVAPQSTALVPGKQPIPSITLRQIKAEYGPLAYVPRLVPTGYIFTSWRIREPSKGYLMPTLELKFGRSGTLLIWSVADGRGDETYADCSRKPYFDFTRRIEGRIVYYANGNHGDSAWICLDERIQSTGFRQPVGIDVWVDNNRGRPSPITAMRMVASARRTSMRQRVQATGTWPVRPRRHPRRYKRSRCLRRPWPRLTTRSRRLSASATQAR
jgi:hypothetical protein